MSSRTPTRPSIDQRFSHSHSPVSLAGEQLPPKPSQALRGAAEKEGKEWKMLEGRRFESLAVGEKRFDGYGYVVFAPLGGHALTYMDL